LLSYRTITKHLLGTVGLRCGQCAAWSPPRVARALPFRQHCKPTFVLDRASRPSTTKHTTSLQDRTYECPSDDVYQPRRMICISGEDNVQDGGSTRISSIHGSSLHGLKLNSNRGYELFRRSAHELSLALLMSGMRRVEEWLAPTLKSPTAVQLLYFPSSFNARYSHGGIPVASGPSHPHHRRRLNPPPIHQSLCC